MGNSNNFANSQKRKYLSSSNLYTFLVLLLSAKPDFNSLVNNWDQFGDIQSGFFMISSSTRAGGTGDGKWAASGTCEKNILTDCYVIWHQPVHCCNS